MLNTTVATSMHVPERFCRIRPIAWTYKSSIGVPKILKGVADKQSASDAVHSCAAEQQTVYMTSTATLVCINAMMNMQQ